MARDRLAAMRAQQGNVGGTSYPTQASGEYQSRRQNPFAQQDEPSEYEMSGVNGSRTHLASAAPGGAAGGGSDNATFYDEISSLQASIRTFNDNVARIGELHSRSLDNTDDATTQRISAQLDEMVEEMSAMSSTLKRRIKALEAKGGTRDRKNQTALVKSKFVEAIQNYQSVEQQYRTKYKQRMERQFRIVKPNATPEEVRAVVNDESGGAIFTQALMSARVTDSRAAYREVQERHQDIQRIEKTIAELAQLFQDMSILVEQQDETINVIETQAAAVEKDMEVGLSYTDKAVASATAARKKRWICFFIIVILLIIIGVAVGISVKNMVGNNNNNNNTTQ